MVNVILDKEAVGLPEDVKLHSTFCLTIEIVGKTMAKEQESKLNYHEEENAMVTDLDDLKIR